MYYNFTLKMKQTVYKWWCLVYRPVYRLFHHGYWPNEKQPYVKYPDPVPPEASQPAAGATVEDDPQKKLAAAMAAQIVESNRSSQTNVDSIIHSVEEPAKEAPAKEEAPAQKEAASKKEEPQEFRTVRMEHEKQEVRTDATIKLKDIEAAKKRQEDDDGLSTMEPRMKDNPAMAHLDPNEIPEGVADDVLSRANEIMARLNQEAAADAAKKQAEIEEARAKAEEQAKLDSIMKANSRNIEGYIEEGRSKQGNNISL